MRNMEAGYLACEEEKAARRDLFSALESGRPDFKNQVNPYWALEFQIGAQKRK